MTRGAENSDTGAVLKQVVKISKYIRQGALPGIDDKTFFQK